MDDALSPSRGSADAWIAAAYDVLVDQGVDAVKVMTLAKALGLSRTGFYWHFKDRDALLAALLDRWRDKNTGNLIRRTEAYADTITEAAFNLFDCWLRPDLFDAQFDFAIRNWALGDPQLRLIVEASDAIRIKAIRAMFERFGFGPDQARVRSYTVYYTQIGYISMMVKEPPEVRLPRMPLYVEAFTGTTPTQAEVARFAARHGMTLSDLGIGQPAQG